MAPATDAKQSSGASEGGHSVKNDKKDTTNESKNGSAATNEKMAESWSSEPPSMTFALFLYWIVPLIVVASLARMGIELPSSKLPSKPSNTVSIDWNQMQKQYLQKPKKEKKKKKKSSKYSSGYQEVLDIVNERRRKYNVPQLTSRKSQEQVKQHEAAKDEKQEESKVHQSTTSPSSRRRASTEARGATSDPARIAADEDIQQKRIASQKDPTNYFKLIALADAMRQRDFLFHDGGSLQNEALETYQKAIDLVLAKREQAVKDKESTNTTLGASSLPEELFLPNESKSIDGLLCSLYTAQGKMYFMANMFEKSVEQYEKVLEMEPLYLDALGAMGSSLIILGRYEEAGQAFETLLQNDKNRIFMDVFTGMAKVLTVKESAVTGGWQPMVSIMEEMIPQLEGQIASAQEKATSRQKQVMADSLNRLHHAMFVYHDVKTKDTQEAWSHLQKGYKHKMSALPPWNAQFEAQKSAQTKQIFKEGFWPAGVGSDSQTPIFIIGFVRSGSTLLERVLDAHPLIVGTGEDSVFNGRLDEIRNAIVQASWTGSSEIIQAVVLEQADFVVDGMRKRWEILESKVQREEVRDEPPQRFADKMLTNYMNVGFLHMLFPKALILHVAREPMDTVFSAYKHEFPTGTLDYTSDFPSLAQLYHQYRDIIEHWDQVLPGRVTHVRYEDMVHDMPGVAKAIIAATGLEWSEDVLEFHKKKHAVNTLSTTQVRKQVYKDSLQAWRRYEQELQPLVDLLGDHATWDLKTTLPSYVKPVAE